MDIKNIMMIFVVLVAAVSTIAYFLKKNKNEEVQEAVEVDDKTYTLDKMVKFVNQDLTKLQKSTYTISVYLKKN